MKICVLNLSGNVGKSTLAVHLLAAYAPGARILSIESINASAADRMPGLDVEELGASRFKEILRELMQGEDVIVDVGASNVAAFMAEMKRFKSAVGEFDWVLVPTVPALKQQLDTIATIDWLHGLGLDGRKVRVIFNQYASDAQDPVQVVYSQVLGYAAADGQGKAVYEPHAVVDHNEVYELAKDSGQVMRALAGSTTDWRAARGEAKRAGDRVALECAISGQITHDLAVTAHENLERVHAMLFGDRRANDVDPAPSGRKRA